MSVKFHSQAPTAIQDLPAHRPAALSGHSMAPPGLTPLPKPSGGAPLARVVVSQDPGPVDDYSAFFSAHRNALLERLSAELTTPNRARLGGLPDSQRSACATLLRTVAAAVDASRGE